MSAAASAFPAFFAAAPRLTVRDPLAEFLGTAPGGVMEYGYADAVRLSGHSCSTVASAYLMTVYGLRALYGGQLPVRGEIAVYLRDARDRGANGVVATVVQLLTGAAAETGFRGIGARFSRHGLLRFDQPVQETLGLRRNDTGQALQVSLDASLVAWPDEMHALLPKAAAGRASETELARFGQLWQDRVRRIFEQADDPRLIRIRPWQAPAAAGA
ncbi:MAG TPA: FmdE family protein [Rubrivivax sp.]|nr:FmdE family protein [Rubrivivax sp.]HPO17971.1 FmdE family protein [Rubrivivax sp.]